MKPLSFVIQIALAGLLGIALWRVASQWKFPGDRQPGATSPPASARGTEHLGTAGEKGNPPVEEPLMRPPLFKSGKLRIPLESLHPLQDEPWIPGAFHFLLEEVPGGSLRRCVLAAGSLQRLGDWAVELTLEKKPPASKLAAYAQHLGLPLQMLLLPRAAFRRLHPEGLPPCAKWVHPVTTQALGNAGPEILRVGARRSLTSPGLVAARILQGRAVGLEHRPMGEGYLLHALAPGEAVLEIQELPGPRIRHLRIRVTPRAVRSPGKPRNAPTPPPEGVFVIPGWTSEKASR